MHEVGYFGESPKVSLMKGAPKMWISDSLHVASLGKGLQRPFFYGTSLAWADRSDDEENG